jgi:hypothetical protein
VKIRIHILFYFFYGFYVFHFGVDFICSFFFQGSEEVFGIPEVTVCPTGYQSADTIHQAIHYP